MTEQEKELLLVDLCARLPYHLLGRDAFDKTREMKVIYPTGTIIAQEIDGECCSSCGFVPYLRPISSMTEKELYECRATCKYRQVGQSVLDCATIETFDWLNAHHFDYRGLIPLGLGIDCTGLNIYENEKSI